MNLADLLFGKRTIEESEPQPQYGEAIQTYLDNLDNQDYFKSLLNRPTQTGLTPEQYKIGITQGLNYGVPEIAEAQKQLGIRLPVTGEDKQLAELGAFNQYPVIKAGITGTPREGGLLNDFSRGYNENYNNRFAVSNLMPSGKNWATRIGEGLGTVGRFIDSPLGRGIIAGGLNSALGYDNSLREGLTAAVGRQNYQTQDKLFRQQLKNDYGYTDEDLNNIPGNLTKDMFNSLALSSYRTKSLRVRQEIANASDNTKRANIIMQGLNNGVITPQEAQIQMANYGITLEDLQKSNATRNADINEYLAPHKARAYDTGAIVGMGNLALNREKFERGEQPTLNNIFSMANHFDSLPEVKNFKEIDRQFKNVESVYNDYKSGKLRANASDQAMITTLNKILDPTSVVRESEFARTAQGQATLAKIEGYAKKITKGGSGLTDKERQDLFNSMKTMRNAAYNTYSQTAQTYTDMANRYGINPNDIIRYNSGTTNNVSGTTKSGVKYKVVK